MQVHDVEQGSEEWHALRAGRPTASDFSKVVTSKGEPSKQAETYAATLAAELYVGKPVDAWEGNSWTERGKELEADALDLYAYATDHEIERVGFVTNFDMGCSPDAFAGDGMAEVKCLKAENHIKTILYYQKHKRCPTDYVQQTQGQLLICERAWCDLIFYHPDLPLLTIRQEPDGELFKALANQVQALIKRRDEIYAAIMKQAEGDALSSPI